MKTAIILHGMPSREEYFDASDLAQSRKHWLGWLQREGCPKENWILNKEKGSLGN